MAESFPPEFHNLSERLLNHESEGDTAWGNLGDWTQATTYPAACAALADRLAQALALQADDRLLNLAFGCGDEVLHWHRHYGVRWIAGLNPSRSQTALAQTRLRDAGYRDTAERLSVGQAEHLREWARQAALPPPSVILALDGAYHFDRRSDVLREAARQLPSGGRLGLTDLVLARPPRGALEQAALMLMSRMARIPYDNLVTEAVYRQQWQQAGFEITHWTDLSAQVLQPFGQWLSRYRATLDPRIARAGHWGKATVTARFLAWADRRQLLRYIVCAGIRTAPLAAQAPAHRGSP